MPSTTPNPAHTPLPWRQSSIAAGDEYTTRIIARWKGRKDVSATVAKCGPHDPYVSCDEAEANAALIVRAVNSHESLMSAARRFLAADNALGAFTAASGAAWHRANDARDAAQEELKKAIANAERRTP